MIFLDKLNKEIDSCSLWKPIMEERFVKATSFNVVNTTNFDPTNFDTTNLDTTNPELPEVMASASLELVIPL